MPSLPSLPPPDALGEELRVATAVVAAVLLLQGARFYRLAVVAPGILLGLAGGAALCGALELGHQPTLAICGVLAVVGGVVCHLGERLAVVIAGVLAGLALVVACRPLVASGLPWWAPVAGAGLGGVLGPVLHRAALPFLTSAIATPPVVWAMEWPLSPVALGGVFAVGVIVQLYTGGGGAQKEGSGPRSRG
jgi:hypothetical protein